MVAQPERRRSAPGRLRERPAIPAEWVDVPVWYRCQGVRCAYG